MLCGIEIESTDAIFAPSTGALIVLCGIEIAGAATYLSHEPIALIVLCGIEIGLFWHCPQGGCVGFNRALWD